MTQLSDTPAGGPTTEGEAAAMLIDRYLPAFDATQIEHLVIDADVATTWAALRELDLMQIHTPLLDAAMFLRGLPARVAARFGATRPSTPSPTRLTLAGDGSALPGWLPLGEVTHHEIALGAVGRFWQPDIKWYDVTGMSPADFAAFTEPGWGRIAANFSLRPYGTTRTLVSYEARTAITDPASARRFARYWLLVRPVVAHIMRAALAGLRHDAERRAGSAN
jgi:hypothetical protein